MDLCDGKKETALKRQRSANNILFSMIGVNPMKCNPCKPTQPECAECEFAKPQTNADRIRAMTDEELAIALYAGCSGRECPEGMCDKPLTEDEEDSLCLKCTIAWLKAPVEVDNGT